MSQLHSQPLVVSDDPFECVSGIPVKGSSQVKKGMRCISFCVTQQLLYPWIDSHGTSRMFFCNISFSISGYNLQSEMGHFTWTGSRKYRNWKSTMCLQKSTSFRTRSFRLPVPMYSTSGWWKIDNFRFVWTVYIPQASFKSAHGFGRSSCVTHKMKCLWYQYENYRNFSTFRNRKNIHKILLRRLEMKFKKRVRNLTIIWVPILNPYLAKMGQLGNSIILQIQKFLSKKRTRF